MSCDIYSRQYVIHYRAKTQSIQYTIRIMEVMFFVHKSLKRHDKKENAEKKMKNYWKELKDHLWDIAVYCKLSFLKNSSQSYI